MCESDARSKSTEIDDPFKDRELPGQRGTRSCLCLLPLSHLGTLKGPRILLRRCGISLTTHVLPWVLFCVILDHLQCQQWTGKGWECPGGQFIACLPFENMSGIRIFRKETGMPGGPMGEERAQHWKFFFQVWPGQDSFHLAGIFSSLVPPEQGKRTQLAIVSGPTGSLTLHGPGRAAFLVH